MHNIREQLVNLCHEQWSGWMKSPLRYPGSKNKIAEQIANMAPEFKEYREPFVGGGSIYLANRQEHGNNKKYWINDLYYDLYNFWINLQQNYDEMADLLYRMTDYYSGNDQGKIMQQYLRHNWHKWNDIQKATAYYILNNISFSGFARGFSRANFEKFKAADYKIDLLKNISKILCGIKITNLDYSEIINAPGEDVFIICDPPYFNIRWPELYGKSGSQNLHAKFDHQRFANIMRDCKYPFLITYDDSQTIRRLFSWANICEFELTYTSRHVKVGNEIFISNYELPKDDDDQLNIDDAWN